MEESAFGASLRRHESLAASSRRASVPPGKNAWDTTGFAHEPRRIRLTLPELRRSAKRRAQGMLASGELT
jgi:hypothetical protein